MRELIEHDVNKMAWKERAKKLKNFVKQEESNRLIEKREENKSLAGAQEAIKEMELPIKEYGHRIKKVCKPFARSIKGKFWPSFWDTTDRNYIAKYGEGPPKRFGAVQLQGRIPLQTSDECLVMDISVLEVLV